MCVCDKEVCERWCVTKWRRWYVEEKWAEEEQELDPGGADPKNRTHTMMWGKNGLMVYEAARGQSCCSMRSQKFCQRN